MRKIRDVLRLHYSAGLSIRQIHSSTKISVGSVQTLLKKAQELALSWPLPEYWMTVSLPDCFISGRYPFFITVSYP